MHAEPTSDIPPSAAYDTEALADLGDLFGPTRLHELLASLDAEIAARIGRIEAAAGGGDWKRLGEHAHALVSAGGSLGFLALSGACARLEEACLSGRADASGVDAVMSDAAAARRAIATLRGGA